MLKTFLSYAREDFEFVNSIFNLLTAHGYLPWMDKRLLLPGQDWQQEIVRSIKASDAFIVFFSSNSVGKRGVFQKELKLALDQLDYLLENDVYILPILIDECKVPEKFGNIQWIEKDDPEFKTKLLNSLNLIATQSQKLVNGTRLIKYVTKEEDYPSLKVRSTYPQIETEEIDTRVSQVNSIISGTINSQIFRMKRLYGPQDDLLDSKIGSELLYTAEVTLFSTNFISVYIRHYTYGSGAAHGNHASETLNIDMLHGVSFGLTDILNATGKFVSDCISKIDAKYDLENSLAGSQENLSESINASMDYRFKIDRLGISLFFDPYEIFPYSFGIIEIEFTWSELKKYRITSLGSRVTDDLVES